MITDILERILLKKHEKKIDIDIFSTMEDILKKEENIFLTQNYFTTLLECIFLELRKMNNLLENKDKNVQP